LPRQRILTAARPEKPPPRQPGAGRWDSTQPPDCASCRFCAGSRRTSCPTPVHAGYDDGPAEADAQSCSTEEADGANGLVSAQST
jgi:hypothetical protein